MPDRHVFVATSVAGGVYGAIGVGVKALLHVRKGAMAPAMGRGRYTKRCVAWPLSLTTCVSPVTGSRKGLCTPHVQTTDLGRINCTDQQQAGEADGT